MVYYVCVLYLPVCIVCLLLYFYELVVCIIL